MIEDSGTIDDFLARHAADVEEAVRKAAAAEIMPRFRQLAAHEVDQKSGPHDLVTDADRKAELYLAEALGALLPVLSALRAVPRTTETRGAHCLLDGVVPAARVHALEQRLPGLTRGEGELESAFDHYAPVDRGAPVPERPRTDHNPLNRREYLLNVTRRSLS